MSPDRRLQSDGMSKVSDGEEWSAERRCALVVSILRGDISIDDAAREHGLSPEQVQNWHDRFLAGASKGARAAACTSIAGSARAAIAILVVWLGLRIVYWNGYYTEDSPGYVTDAIFASLGQYHARDHVNGLNVGTYLPVAIPIALLGKSEIALSIWPAVLLSIGPVFHWRIGDAAVWPRSMDCLPLFCTRPTQATFSFRPS